MIVYPEFAIWDYHFPEGQCVAPSVFCTPAERVSALLGPDGEPLRVGFERPRIGFDLRPKKEAPDV